VLTFLEEITLENIDAWFGKEIKDKIEELLGKKINVFRQTSANFEILRDGEKELSRPYVNAVKIKLIKDKSYFKHSTLKDDFLSHKSDFQVSEQDFRIIQKTTFEQLKIAA
jgi:hypothetical protein